MKKRKVKLFASIASLAMVVAVMGVGVWAATNQSVAVSSTVGFQATSIAGNVKLTVSNAGSADILDEAHVTTTGNTDPQKNLTNEDVTTEQTLAIFAMDKVVTAYTADVKVKLVADNDGKLEGGSQIVYTFVISADEGSNGIFYTVAQDTSTVQLNELFTCTIENGTNWTSGEALGTGVTNAAPATVTVTYELKADRYESIGTAEAYAQLGNLSIKLSNAAQAETLGYHAPEGE